ncbi:MAG: FAD binding domain-containing protein [Spirochaetaceae bacterium]|jgi:CO/xanthine dehydrogenase FAD-binding subunit|nr:FAD binding domain-containing protein [Spirochaetaceae bacterium]
MKTRKITVYQARNINDLYYILRNIPSVSVVGGCTRIALTGQTDAEHSTAAEQSSGDIQLPEATVSIRAVQELKTITKTERYIEFGAGVTLSEILDLGEKNLPSVLFEAIKTIAAPAIRNMATIGGNVTGHTLRMTTHAPLLALDAKLEVRGAADGYMIPLSQYSKPAENTFISKIRVPIDEWDVAVFRRVGSPHSINEKTASFVFLAKTEKNILTNFRIAFSGSLIFRNRQFENMLIGSSLPLSQRWVTFMMEKAAEYLTAEDGAAEESRPLLKAQFLNLLREAFETLM